MVIMYDLVDLKNLFSWRPHSNPITCLTYDPTDTLVASGSTDQTIKIWDIENRYCTHNLRGHEGVITIVKFHPQPGKLQLFSASNDCTVRLWDLKQKK